MSAEIDHEIGSRVKVVGKPELGEGTVKFSGTTQFATGNWIGLELDGPIGKNDGSVQGIRYFEVQPEYGLFVRPNQLISASSPSEEEKTPAKAIKTDPKVEKSVEKTAEKSSTGKTGVTKTSSGTATTAVKASTKPRTSLATPTASSATKTSASSSGASTPLSTVKSSVARSSSTTTATVPKRPSSRESTDSTSTTPLRATSSASRLSSGTKTSSKTSTPLATTPSTRSPAPSVPSSPPSEESESAESKEEEDTEQVEDKEEEEEENQKEEVEPKKEEPATPVRSNPVTPSSILSEEKTETPSTPSAAAGTASPALRAESVDKIMKALKEANEFKVKAQDTIRGLQQRLKETAVQNEKLAKEIIAGRDSLEKEKEKVKKEVEKEWTKLQKQWEKEKEELEEAAASASESLEMTTLDREIAEEKAEALEAELEALKEKMKILEIEGKPSTKSADSSATSPSLSADATELQEQNEKLKEALMKLRDLSVNEKQEREKRIKELERENKAIPGLNEKVLKLEVDLGEKMDEIEELKEALDAAGDAEDMIEDLSNKLMNLEEKVAEQQGTIDELEEMRDISQELEESQAAEEKLLRSEIYSKEVEILDLGGQITNLTRKIAEYDRTVQQFRILVKGQQDEILSMRRRESESQSQTDELTQQSRDLMSLTHQLQTQVVKATAISIDMAISDLNASQSELQFQFVKDVLGDSFARDYYAFSFLLFVRRLQKKAQVVEQNVAHHQVDLDKTKEYDVDELAFYEDLRYILKEIHSISSNFVYVMDRCDAETYLRLGNSYLDLSSLEKRLDDVLTLLKEEQFTKSYNLNLIKEVSTRLNALFDNQIRGNHLSLSKYLGREVAHVEHFCHVLLLEEKKFLKGLNRATDLPADTLSKLFLHFPRKKVQINLELCRKVERSLLDFEPTGEGRENSLSQIKTSKEISQKAFAVLEAVKSESASALSNLRGATEGQIFTSFGQFLQEKYKLDHEWKWLEDLMNPIYSNLSDLSQNITLGVAVNKNEEEGKTAYSSRMAIIQEELKNASIIKTKLDEKSGEIIELKKHLQAREGELQDLKWKEQSLEKKIQRLQKSEEKLNLRITEDSERSKAQEKMYSEALDTLQKDQDTLTAEIKQWKEKVNQLNKKAETKEQTAIDVPSGLIFDQISEMRDAIRYLTQENSFLRGKEAVRTLERELPPLPLINSRIRVEKESAKGQLEQEVVANSAKEVRNMLKEIKVRSVNTNVIDLSKKGAESSLLQLRSERDALYERMKSLKSKLSSHVNLENIQPIQDQQSKSIMMGKLHFSNCGSNSVKQRIAVDPFQFSKIVSLVAK